MLTGLIIKLSIKNPTLSSLSSTNENISAALTYILDLVQTSYNRV